MELNNVEVEVIEKTLAQAANDQLRELNELQLLLVGGGIGDTII